MRVNRVKRLLFHLMIFLFILSACNHQSAETSYYLSLKGASETWELLDYEIMLNSDERKIGDGKLFMAEESEYFTDSFHFSTHAVIKGVDQIIHAGSVSGQTDISEQMTGSIVGDNGTPLPLEEISNIYMMVEWWDTAKNENVQERIELYREQDNEETL